MNINPEMKHFGGKESELDKIYSDLNYENEFYIKTKTDDIIKVSLAWEQGRYNNYRFVKGDIFCYDSDQIIWPEDVDYIEVIK